MEAQTPWIEQEREPCVPNHGSPKSSGTDIVETRNNHGFGSAQGTDGGSADLGIHAGVISCPESTGHEASNVEVLAPGAYSGKWRDGFTCSERNCKNPQSETASNPTSFVSADGKKLLEQATDNYNIVTAVVELSEATDSIKSTLPDRYSGQMSEENIINEVGDCEERWKSSAPASSRLVESQLKQDEELFENPLTRSQEGSISSGREILPIEIESSRKGLDVSQSLEIEISEQPSDDSHSDPDPLMTKFLIEFLNLNGPSEIRIAKLDTGAEVNIVGEELVSDLGVDLERYEGPPLVGLGSSPVHPLGQVKLRWRVNRRTKSHAAVFLVLSHEYTELFDVLFGEETIRKIGFFKVNHEVLLLRRGHEPTFKAGLGAKRSVSFFG